MVRGDLTAALTAFAVTSWNSMRQALSASMPSTFARCHEIASPSRSGSVARKILLAPRASLRMRLKISPRPRMVMYFGSKPFSTSTPSCDFGRSRTWPCEASTL